MQDKFIYTHPNQIPGYASASYAALFIGTPMQAMQEQAENSWWIDKRTPWTFETNAQHFCSEAQSCCRQWRGRCHIITCQPSAQKVAAKPTVGPVTKHCLNMSDSTLQATIACMTASDGLPFRPFVMSPDLRKCLMALGYGPTALVVLQYTSFPGARESREWIRSFPNSREWKKRSGNEFPTC